MDYWVEKSSLVGNPLENQDKYAGNCCGPLTFPLFVTMIKYVNLNEILKGLKSHPIKERVMIFLIFKILGLKVFSRPLPFAKLLQSSFLNLNKHLYDLENHLKDRQTPWMVGTDFSLADTMGWASPHKVESVLGEVRNEWPEMQISLHLHDTRGLAVANAYAALKMGIHRFDSTVAGLGGCPFAGQPKAAGNICTEELVLLCEELGIETGVNLEALIEVGRLAEDIVGHQLPSELIHAGSLNAFRRNISH